MPETAPLRHSAQRHTLLHQIDAHADTPRRWIRIRNPRKTNPDSGLPDYLYNVADPDHRPGPPEQRAVRELDRHGLLHATPTSAGHEDLDVSTTGSRLLAAWKASFGDPDPSE
jgi:hypothetical protein